MTKRGLKILLLSSMTLSLMLTACRPEAAPLTATPQPTNETTVTATAAPSRTPTLPVTPTVTPTVTATPTATPPWEGLTFAQTPLPELAGQITTGNTGFVVPLAIWGTGSPNEIALSPNGQVLAVGTNLGLACYDSLSYARLASYPTTSPVKAIAFASDNLRLALGLADGRVEILDQGDFSPLAQLPAPDPGLSRLERLTLAFSPDGGELFQVIETPQQIQVHRWDAATWQSLAAFSLEPGLTAYTSASLDLIGTIENEDLTLHSLSYPEEQDLLDLPAAISPAFWEQMAAQGGNVAASSNGEFILISNGGAIAHWALLAEEFTYLLDDYPNRLPDPCTQAPDTCLNAADGFSWDCDDASLQSPIGLIALTPDDVMALISRNDGLTEFRRASDSLMLWEIEATFTAVTFSPGGEFFFGLRPNNTIEKRTTLDGALIDFLDLHPGQLDSAAFSPDGGTLAAGFGDGWVRVFSTGNGQMLGVLNGNARSLQFSPDGALLAAGLVDGTVRIFILEAGSFYDLAPGHQAAVTDLAFSATGDLLFTGSDDCTISVWQVAERYRVQILVSDAQAPFRVSQVATGWDEQTQFISGNRTGVYAFAETNLEAILLSEMTILDLTRSPNGAWLAIAGDGVHLVTLQQNSVAGARTQLDVSAPAESYAVAFNATGDLLADATLDRIHFWSPENGTRLASLPIAAYVTPENPPISLTFSPNNTLLALATADGLIQIFGVPVSPGN